MNELDLTSNIQNRIPTDENTMSTTTNPNSSTNVNADEETKERIKHLAIVGTALYQTTNEINFQTDFFAAKEALNRFKEGIDKLKLDEKSQRGMDDLIHYLQKKIDRRLTHSENQNQSPLK